MSFAKRSVFSVPLLAAFLLTGLALAARAQGPIPSFLLDHYTVYFSDATETVSGEIKVRDQFGDRIDLFEGPIAFLLPTLKRIEPDDDPVLVYPHAHLSAYSIQSNEPGRLVTVQNQFGDQTLEVGDGRAFLAPALKNPTGTSGPPDEIDHFRCYQAKGVSANIVAQLEDQFRVIDTQILEPFWFCNPAEKTLPDGTVYPIGNPDDHLVCYSFPSTLAQTFTINLLDQFLQGDGAFVGPLSICVPSKKAGVVQAEESTWGQLKAIYR